MSRACAPAPTSRSATLIWRGSSAACAADPGHHVAEPGVDVEDFAGNRGDRKSTRLNSSHSQISYAVFCLKKKKIKNTKVNKIQKTNRNYVLKKLYLTSKSSN